MSKIIECIPNFSEGKNQAVIDKISEAAASVPNARLIKRQCGPCL